MDQTAINYFLIGGSSLFLGFVISLGILSFWAKGKAKRLLNKDKTAFIAIASHYLLTPLSIIESSIATIQEHEATFSLEQREAHHGIIKEGADRLLRIAEQMILVISLDNGQLNLTRSIQSLNNIVQSVIRKYDKIARRRGIFIRFMTDPNNQFEGQYDARALEQAIDAIINNAIKFSPDGSAVVVVLQDLEQNYVIEVRDQGLGMTAEQLQMAKEKFYRGTPPYQFDYEGIGLGLYVADVVIRAHSGQILIQTPGKNQGTVVQLILPKFSM